MYIYNLIYIIIIYIYITYLEHWFTLHGSHLLLPKRAVSALGALGTQVFFRSATCCLSACRVEAATEKGPNQRLVSLECLPEVFNPPFCPMRSFVG